jgi:hypothetical protein
MFIDALNQVGEVLPSFLVCWQFLPKTVLGFVNYFFCIQVILSCDIFSLDYLHGSINDT